MLEVVQTSEDMQFEDVAAMLAKALEASMGPAGCMEGAQPPLAVAWGPAHLLGRTCFALPEACCCP